MLSVAGDARLVALGEIPASPALLHAREWSAILWAGLMNMPPTITVASGRCTWLPMPVETAAGSRPRRQSDYGALGAQAYWLTSQLCAQSVRALRDAIATPGNESNQP